MSFRDRADAGRKLAERLEVFRPERPVVVGLPRGGVPVAAEVARVLDAPLDVLVVRKLGHPAHRELGLGAIGEGGALVLNRGLIDQLRVAPVALQRVKAQEERELARRVARYRGDRPRLAVDGRTVILVDDGLATGFTARAAVEVLRHAGARRVVLAVPVAPVATADELRAVADEVVCLDTPTAFDAIGRWYDDFRQVGDAEVIRLLAGVATAAPVTAHLQESEVEVVAGGRRLAGTLAVPDDSVGLVLFAHGTGGRTSPRNRFVADRLNRTGFATLLFDLLTNAEALDGRNVFDIGLLGRRLIEATGWCRRQGLPPSIGYFGASTGAGAALAAAAHLGADVEAVVSRGGRPDLAMARLPAVTAPTLLIVGELDHEVLELNRRASLELTRCDHQLVVVRGSTHLFEEPGALQAVADLAASWFAIHLHPTAATNRRSSA
jgi:predicted phosphoribosyltransferase/dienelactone hydrolase